MYKNSPILQTDDYDYYTAIYSGVWETGWALCKHIVHVWSAFHWMGQAVGMFQHVSVNSSPLLTRDRLRTCMHSKTDSWIGSFDEHNQQRFSFWYMTVRESHVLPPCVTMAIIISKGTPQIPYQSTTVKHSWTILTPVSIVYITYIIVQHINKSV